MKPIRFHPEARDELAHEALYLSAVSVRLAERFVAAVEAATQLASEFPGIGSPYLHRTQRVFPRGKFRFSVVYVERPAEVYVIAIAPFARKPGYWRARRDDA